MEPTGRIMLNLPGRNPESIIEIFPQSVHRLFTTTPKGSSNHPSRIPDSGIATSERKDHKRTLQFQPVKDRKAVQWHGDLESSIGLDGGVGNAGPCTRGQVGIRLE
jgi:hypothetical protein